MSNNYEAIKQASAKILLIPLAAGAGSGAIIGAATSPKGDRASGALHGAGVGSIVGGGTGAIAGIAKGIRNPRLAGRSGKKDSVDKVIKKIVEMAKTVDNIKAPKSIRNKIDKIKKSYQSGQRTRPSNQVAKNFASSHKARIMANAKP